jgi:hypothetical protein
MVSPSKIIFAVVTGTAIVAAHVVDGIDSGDARLHGESYLVRFPLVCQSCKGLQFCRIKRSLMTVVENRDITH